MSEDNGRPLPAEWARATLADVAQINPALGCCPINDSVKVNFIPMRAVEPEGDGITHPEMRDYSEVKKGYTPFMSGDVIMAKITPCMENGKFAVVRNLPGDICYGSTEFHVLRPEGGVLPAWLHYFMLQLSFRRVARRSMGGAVGQLRVPVSFVETASVSVAPTAEQARVIAVVDELFSDLDAGVAALERVKAKLAHYRASVLKAAVEGALTAEWRKDHPDTEPAAELLVRILADRRRRWEEEQ